MNIQELEPNLLQAATLMEMLSGPHRLHLLCNLLDGEQNVTWLAEKVGLSQPAMSHHLKKLKLAGLVKTRREAQTIYYGLAGNHAREVLILLHKLYCQPQEMDKAKSGASREPVNK